MKTFLNLIINFSLFLIAPLLELILMPVNVAVVFAKDWQKKGFKEALKGFQTTLKSLLSVKMYIYARNIEPFGMPPLKSKKVKK